MLQDSQTNPRPPTPQPEHPRWRGGSDKLGLLGLVVVLSLLACTAYGFAAFSDRFEAHSFAPQWIPRIEAAFAEQQAGRNADAVRNQLVELASHAKQTELLHGFLTHLAIAFAVAALLIVLVEIRVRRLNRLEMQEFKNQVSDSVWTAISGQLVPKTIVEQMQAVLRFTTIREDVSYLLIFDEAPPLRALDSQRMVRVTRRMAYKIRKLDPRKSVEHKISSNFDIPVFKTSADGGVVYPRYVEFFVDGREGAKKSSSSIEEHIDVGTKERQVLIECEEIFQREDQIYYIVGAPVSGLTVQIVNNLKGQIFFTGVQTTHSRVSDAGHLKPLVAQNSSTGCWDYGSWEYPGALLPGQGFRVAWVETPPPQVTEREARPPAISTTQSVPPPPPEL